MKLKKGDNVYVITGKDKGKQGDVYKIDKEKNLVWVKGVNLVKKHQKPTQKNRQGGIVEKEAPVQLSNVMYYDEKAGKPTRLGYKTDKKGHKVRFTKKSGTSLDT